MKAEIRYRGDGTWYWFIITMYHQSLSNGWDQVGSKPYTSKPSARRAALNLARRLGLTVADEVLQW